ncbi:uncharacterized protein BT62DRAFT_1012175 [Guyanagaster necrorhizus]|uniref:Uncharacterized protein n=1 Tax=Guyanagaster necrorhizus TaxID=856835 RepID=A0A9P7VJ84_9AGAR|nr:uncharacterized protein BT62DRAFT_1012175 [Guyanagaster necrorhizus MCA 3950]KAG7440954.1 hypothetical protein BT62DRAFT_1012175 [Guyanagaster necrorhizus MCA 3950]
MAHTSKAYVYLRFCGPQNCVPFPGDPPDRVFSFLCTVFQTRIPPKSLVYPRFQVGPGMETLEESSEFFFQRKCRDWPPHLLGYCVATLPVTNDVYAGILSDLRSTLSLPPILRPSVVLQSSSSSSLMSQYESDPSVTVHPYAQLFRGSPSSPDLPNGARGTSFFVLSYPCITAKNPDILYRSREPHTSSRFSSELLNVDPTQGLRDMRLRKFPRV